MSVCVRRGGRFGWRDGVRWALCTLYAVRVIHGSVRTAAPVLATDLCAESICVLLHASPPPRFILAVASPSPHHPSILSLVPILPTAMETKALMM